MSCRTTDISTEEINRLISEHRSLVILALTAYELTSDEVIYITRQLESLKIIYFHIKSHFEYRRLLKQKSDEWKLDVYRRTALRLRR